MYPAQAREIAKALEEGGGVVRGAHPICMRALVRDGLAVWRGAELVVTEEGKRALATRKKRSAAASEPEIVIVDGAPVDLRQRCARCGAQFGSHKKRGGYPLPERKCSGFLTR